MLRIKLEFSLCDVIWGLEERRERDITLKYVINDQVLQRFITQYQLVMALIFRSHSRKRDSKVRVTQRELGSKPLKHSIV